jgi:hypothetical protein
MSIPVRSHDSALIGAIVKAFNADRVARVSTNFHVSKTVEAVSGDFRNPTITDAVIATANASNEATLVALCKDIRVMIITHGKDSVGHKVADTVIQAAVATEPSATASCITFLNAAKAAWAVHIASTTYHYNADATNTIAAADATDEASAITLATEMKTDVNAHLANGLAGYSIRMVAP